MSVTDAVVVGAGPNGLAAAVTLARAGLSVLVLEAEATVGGGCRSEELTLPGFVHDVCTAVHPLGVVVARLRRACRWPTTAWNGSIPARRWPIPSPTGGRPMLERSLDATAEGLGATTGGRGGGWSGPLVEPLGRPRRLILGPDAAAAPPPDRPDPLRDAGAAAGADPRPAGLRRRRSPGPVRRAWPPTPSSTWRAPHVVVRALFAASAHAVGWPVARGGSQAITDALVSYLRSLGGEVVTGQRVTSLDDLPPAGPCSSTSRPARSSPSPATACRGRCARRLSRFRYGPGSSRSTTPSTARSPGRPTELRPGRHGPPRRHAGRDAAAEADVARGRHPERPVRPRRAAEPVRSDARARPASTRSGPTATCPTGRPST